MKLNLLLLVFISCAHQVNKNSNPYVVSLKNLGNAITLNGEMVKVEKVVIFACMNIPNNRFLFNKDRTDFCWIKNPQDAAEIANNLKGNFFGENTLFFSNCPQEMATEKFCEPKKLRDF